MHDRHRGDVIIMCHGPGDLGCAQGVVHEVGFTAADSGLHVAAVRCRMLNKSLLPLVDQGDRYKKAYCHSKVGDED